MPKRVRVRQGRGFPDGAVYVGRPTIYGNPFKVTPERSRSEAVACYRIWLQSGAPGAIRVLEALPKLQGRDLACWCPLDGEPCHADVLLELANS